MKRAASKQGVGPASGTQRSGLVKFRAMLQGNGKTAAGMEVPAEVVAALGSSKRPPVGVTINGHTYRSSVAVMYGKFMLGVSSAENWASAGVAAGDVLEVELELDTQPREVTVPPDFNVVLDQDAEARRFFDSLSYSNRLRHVLAIEQAKTPETRQRRIDKSVSMLHEGRA